MAKKKNYSNPALAFFSDPGETPKEAESPAADQITDADPGQEEPKPMEKPEQPPKGYKVNPMYVETKSQRVQLVLQPSVVKRAKKAAAKKKLSFNETASRAIIEYLEREGF